MNNASLGDVAGDWLVYKGRIPLHWIKKVEYRVPPPKAKWGFGKSSVDPI